MHKVFFIFISFLFLISCKPNKDSNGTAENDKKVVSLLQGIWIDGMTETPLFRINKDSIYYVDSLTATVRFKIKGDTLFTFGSVTNAYEIDTITENNFIFKSISGDVIHLIKSNNKDDINLFAEKKGIPIYDNVVKKDSIINFGNVRYRGYVYINPTKIKVSCPTISDEGFSVDNVYYDNIIHICVFEGVKNLFSKDIKKDMFKGIVPDDFLKTSILTDMVFKGVDKDGYKYQATIGNPYKSISYMVDLNISKSKKISYNLAK